MIKIVDSIDKTNQRNKTKKKENNKMPKFQDLSDERGHSPESSIKSPRPPRMPGLPPAHTHNPTSTLPRGLAEGEYVSTKSISQKLAFCLMLLGKKDIPRLKLELSMLVPLVEKYSQQPAYEFVRDDREDS